MHKADLHHSNPVLQRKLERIFALRRTCEKVNWDSQNYHGLLEYFGNPHLRLPPVIHVAGTNGKGSIVAMLRGVCEAAGMRVHAYTSPHLIHVNERIVLGGVEISDDSLEALIDEALAFIGERPLSFFEVITAVAFKVFAEVPADILLLEVGMGGALDCTSVIAAPLASVISRVSLDHTQFLGTRIEEIAAQKAGIMKAESPCVVGYQGSGVLGESVLDVMERHAQQTGTSLVMAKEVEAIEACFVSALSLNGVYQLYNLAVVLSVLECLKQQGIEISKDVVLQGLRACVWPGRLEILNDLWPSGVGKHDLWLDCGHNDSAGDVLAEQIRFWNESDERATYLIVGMLGSKDSSAFLKPLEPLLSGVYVVPVAQEIAAQNAQQIVDACTGLVPVCGCASAQDAVTVIMDDASRPVRILIAGSVYLAGSILQYIN